MVQLFLSHSRETKESLVIPFAQDLNRLQLPYWLDRKDIVSSDDIYKMIYTGINTSSYCVAFIDSTYLQSPWPLQELNAFHQQEVSLKRQVILPVYCGIDKEIVNRRFPWLVDRAFEPITHRNLYMPGERQRLLCRIFSKLLADNDITTDISIINRICCEGPCSNFVSLLKLLYHDGYHAANDLILSCTELCNMILLIQGIAQSRGVLFSSLERAAIAFVPYAKNALQDIAETTRYDFQITLHRCIVLLASRLLIDM